MRKRETLKGCVGTKVLPFLPLLEQTRGEGWEVALVALGEGSGSVSGWKEEENDQSEVKMKNDAASVTVTLSPSETKIQEP